MLPIVGWQKTSLIDYPQRISSILFTPGCNFRCPYCHNSQLVLDPSSLEPVPEEIIWAHLEKRRHLLDGIVITGGEPTLHGDQLTEFIKQAKEMGYLVKLDTNGSHPQILRNLIGEKLIDYVAMDLKTSFNEYPNLAGSQIDIDSLKESIALLKESAHWKLIDLEFRTTLHPSLHTEEIFQEMVQEITNAPLYSLQTFRKEITLDKGYQATQPFTETQMNHFLKLGQAYVKKCLVR